MDYRYTGDFEIIFIPSSSLRYNGEKKHFYTQPKKKKKFSIVLKFLLFT